jgi:hypothetical protein
MSEGLDIHEEEAIPTLLDAIYISLDSHGIAELCRLLVALQNRIAALEDRVRALEK